LRLASLALCAVLAIPAGPARAQPAQAQPALPARAQPAPPGAAPQADSARIVAVVNGDVVSGGDLENRRRLFALSTGLPLSQDVLDRLTPQITRALVDERLRLQEVQRRHIVVADQEIAKAIDEVEARNGMAPGTLRHRLSAEGVALRTLIDQIRVQIGWSRVLHEVLGGQGQVSDADIAEQERLLKEQTGQPEFHVAEIFVPVENPAHAEEAQRFADAVIQQLHAGAAFGVVAAQFSQNQTALQGGDLGWQQPNQMDPQVLRVVQEMPVGAVSNPIRVPGGFSIVTLRGKREIGHGEATVLQIRQAFWRFTSALNQSNPTAQQKQVLEQATRLSASARSCDDVEAANKAAGSGRPSSPGDVTLENISGPMRGVLEKLVPGKASPPLVTEDGIAVIILCSRGQKNLGIPTRQELTERILSERVELASRQLMRDLRRRAVIDLRS
jgi:peptidyl-prolyl cis-trans isomerase SurA